MATGATYRGPNHFSTSTMRKMQTDRRRMRSHLHVRGGDQHAGGDEHAVTHHDHNHMTHWRHRRGTTHANPLMNSMLHTSLRPGA